jgi:hypothetical protein
MVRSFRGVVAIVGMALLLSSTHVLSPSLVLGSPGILHATLLLETSLG